MNFKKINWIIGGFVFAITTFIYIITVQPTMSFWDCGEFLACAYTMGVPHPPGAPLHILVGRIFTMIPFGEDIGFRMNMLSVLSSAFSVLLLYLVGVRVIKNWRGIPKNTYDIILLTLPPAIGALSLAFSDSFWFNTMEAEVYGFGTFLLALSVYLLMIWWDNSDKEHSDRYLLAVAYLSGLALGIHLLVVQVMFLAGLMFYFKRFKFNWKSFSIAVVLSAILFFIFYPGITKKLPELIKSSPSILGLFILVALGFGIIMTYKSKAKGVNLILLAVFLAIIGYSTYISAMMRAGVQDLPVDNNNPENMERMLSYLNREQYGEQPLIWPRRYSMEPMHERTWKNYSSDLDFLWKYQINEMYNRYLFWQYIGRVGHDQGDGVDFKKFFAIPFLLGLFGVFYHFRKDKKLAFIFLMMFIMMGVVTALYQNQQDPQPRERDYFYIGSYFAFSLWIGLGVAGLIELVREAKEKMNWIPATSAILLLGFIFVPVNMLRTNFYYQSRAGNYFPYDYAYNLLQSCDKDAILITNGDNDTFPLWCIQAVYGIRTDVRVVNLSLAQIDWYNLQLKNERPYGSLTVPFNMNDDQIKNLRPMEWPKNGKLMTLDVPKTAYPDTMQSREDLPEKITFAMPPTINVNQGGRQVYAVKVNDLVVLDIVKANKWQRPIYFSVTVTEDNYIGLTEYLMTEGMAQKLYPYKVADPTFGVGIDEEKLTTNLLNVAEIPEKNPKSGFRYRGLNDPDIFYEQVQTRMIDGYRLLFLRLAHKYADKPETHDNAKKVLDGMNTYISSETIRMDYRLIYDVAMLYYRVGDNVNFNKYAETVEASALKELQGPVSQSIMQSYYNPYKILLDIYEAKEDYNKALDILNQLDEKDPSVVLKKQKIMEKMSEIKDTSVLIDSF
ncbi:MAG: DUF2723 domain-containing protein [Ignavibacteria bacterium]|nr:DUF2723 domain-containing protein [Ignavibacteria bacterium]